MNINDTINYLNIGLPEDIRRCQMLGDFDEAIRLIDFRLQQNNIAQCLRNSLIAHKAIFQVIPSAFPYSKEEALEIIRKDIPDYTAEELQEQMDLRNIRWIFINGQVRINYIFYSSMLKAVPGFAARASKQLGGVESATKGSAAAQLLDISMQNMKEKGSLSNRIRIRATIKLKDEQFTPGMFIRAHLPVPAPCQQQSDIRIERVWPETGMIAPEDAAQRTVCWEETMMENHDFGVEYSYIHTAVYKDAYHGKGEISSFRFDTEEKAPHLVFTPYIRALCAELTDGIEDPLMKARAFYDFITLNMKYTFMPGYFVLEDIADTCAKNYTGDCGVFALLFITMCRCVGIPAQWQSGMTAEPDFVGCHDWVRFYVEPYGWIFADPSYGTGAVRLDKEERRQFYFGNLDPYRMVANREFQENFTIPKQQWRADPYDNQMGEIETTDKGFYYHEFDHTMEILCCEEISE